MLLWWLWSCSGGRPSEPCRCDDGHGVVLCDHGECTTCQCLPLAPATPDPTPSVVRFVDADAAKGAGSEGSPWAAPDWRQLDRDVVAGDVLVVFDAGDVWPEKLEIGRTDRGPYRIVLAGSDRRRTKDGWVAAGGRRATVPGISTGFDDVSRDRITVRGFDVTDSDDKGIYWRAGDDILLEDNLVHENRGTPAISLDYTSRSGFRSTGFVVRNNHVWDQHGECLYFGGAEGEDLDAHERLVVENNLIHDCKHPLSEKHDGINVKDRIGSVLVARNVVFATHWGIEVASPAEIRGNLVFATTSNGLHLTDGWGLGLSGLVIEDQVVIDAGEAGIYLNATNNHWSDVTISGLTVAGARQAAVEVGGAGGIEGSMDGLLLTDAKVGLDAWSPMELTLGDCVVQATKLVGDRDFEALAEACVRDDPGFGDLGAPAGPDGRFFTEDDPWVSAAGGARPTEAVR